MGTSRSHCLPNFVDLKTGDRAQLCEVIQHPEVDTALRNAQSHISNVVHADMLKSYAIPVHTSMHYKSYANTMGNLCHIVGIREWNNWDGDSTGRPRARGWRSRLRKGRKAEAEAYKRWRRQLHRAVFWAVFYSTTRDAPFMPLDTEHHDISVWVQASQALPMVKCTPDFSTHFGRPKLRHQTSLLKWLLGTCKDATKRAVQGTVGASLFNAPTAQGT